MMPVSRLSLRCTLVAASVVATAPAAAQNSACALSGEYVLSGSMLSTPPAQLAGFFVFTPPASCDVEEPGAGAPAAPAEPSDPAVAGSVAIDAFWASAQGEVQSFQATVPYVVDGNIVTIGENLLVGGLAGMQGELATAVAIVGASSGELASTPLAATLVRQEYPLFVGPPGPEGPRGRRGPAGFQRVATAELTATIPTSTPTTISVPCPAGGAGEAPYAVGGGYSTNQTALTMFSISSTVSADGRGWEATFLNASADQDATVTVICAYADQ